MEKKFAKDVLALKDLLQLEFDRCESKLDDAFEEMTYYGASSETVSPKEKIEHFNANRNQVEEFLNSFEIYCNELKKWNSNEEDGTRKEVYNDIMGKIAALNDKKETLVSEWNLVKPYLAAFGTDEDLCEVAAYNIAKYSQDSDQFFTAKEVVETFAI